MNNTLTLLGVVCVIAAVVGGGLRALGVELPAIDSVRRQFALAVVGIILVITGNFFKPVKPGEGVPPVQVEIPTTAESKKDGSNIQAEDTIVPAETAPVAKSTSAVPVTETTPGDTAPPVAVEPVHAVVDALQKNPPSKQFTRNQFSKGFLTYTQFFVTGLDILVSARFEYQQRDGTGWPPASPPVESVDRYFCEQNLSTAKLLQNGVGITVSMTVVRGPNSNAFNFQVNCDPGSSQVGPVVQ